MFSAKLHVTAMQASDGVHQVCRLEEVHGDKSLKAMHFGNGTIVYHIDSIVRDRAEDVLVCVPVEHHDVELGEFRQIIISGSPKSG